MDCCQPLQVKSLPGSQAFAPYLRGDRTFDVDSVFRAAILVQSYRYGSLSLLSADNA